MWDDLSKISIALHKSGVPPRPRLNWTLGCLEILEQKRELVRALITVVTSFHIVSPVLDVADKSALAILSSATRKSSV